MAIASKLQGPDRFLFWAHIVQAGLGVLVSLLYFQRLQQAPLWMALGGVLLLAAGLGGAWLLAKRSVFAYPLLTVFNVFQLVWVTTPSTRYGFQYGLHFYVSIFSGAAGTFLALNVIAAVLLVMVVAAWLRRVAPADVIQ